MENVQWNLASFDVRRARMEWGANDDPGSSSISSQLDHNRRVVFRWNIGLVFTVLSQEIPVHYLPCQIGSPFIGRTQWMALTQIEWKITPFRTGFN